MEGINSSRHEKGKDRKPDPILEDLWERFEFIGKPPFKGSVAEERLKKACEEYANVVNSIPKALHAGDSENYFSRNNRPKLISSSDTKRRELHNEIALMVIGKQRSGMEAVLAEHIADFALEYAETI